MIRLFKSFFAVFTIFLLSYLRKGRFIYLLLPALMIFSFIGGLFVNSMFQKEAAVPYFNPDEIESQFMGVAFKYDPSISQDGQFIAFSDVQLELKKIKDIVIKVYDTRSRRYVDLPGIHDKKGWDLCPSINADGSLIAFQSNRKGKTRWDIYVYDIRNKRFLDTQGLNSNFPDFNPSISPDGRYVTFNSVRRLIPYVYTYDLKDKKVTPLSEE